MIDLAACQPVTARFEAHHTSSAQNISGMIKVFLYLVFSILLLPSLAVASISTLLEVSLGGFETVRPLDPSSEALLAPHIDSRALLDQIAAQVGVFPNGAFFVKYLIQVAFISGMSQTRSSSIK